MITAIIGSGGKTTLLHSLAQNYIKEGKSVFITTTTHMLIEPDTVLSDDPEIIVNHLKQNGYVMAGIPEGQKIKSLSLETYNKVCEYADEVLVEADGSKHLPLKIPNAFEPVIPSNVDKIIVVCGVNALDSLASDVIFRLETVDDTFDISPNQEVTPAIIQNLLRKGYLNKLMENYSDKEISIYANGARNLYERAIASLLESNMDVNLINKDWFSPKPCLIICGAGHVSKELADLASKLDMNIKVIDPRSEWANIERFPKAEIINEDFSKLESHLVPNAYYAVLTPGHTDDLSCVSTIMKTSYSYLGMIGSHAKVEKAINSLKDAGFCDEQINSLHAPIGLPIHAQTPVEIAVSIIAEIIEIKNRNVVSSASETLLNSEKHGMLCIIIDKKGSSPRGAGSMMLVTDTEVIDTIGGGSIENEVINAARSHKKAFIQNYTLNNTSAVNIGMVCGGTNTVLFIPV